MIKRFCIFYSKSNGDLAVHISPGFGIVLFDTEEDAIKYMKSNSTYNFMSVFSIYTREEFANTQTVLSSK